MPDYIEWYLVEVDEGLKRKRTPTDRREAILSEVRDHLCSSSRESEDAGQDPDEAARSAINRIGSPRDLAVELSGGSRDLSMRKILLWSMLPGAFVLPIGYLLWIQPSSASEVPGRWPHINLELAYAYGALAAVALLVSLFKTRGWSAVALCALCLVITSANVVRLYTNYDLYVWNGIGQEHRESLVRTELREEEIKIAQRFVAGRNNIITDLELWDAIYTSGDPIPLTPDTTGMTLLVDGDNWVVPRSSARIYNYRSANSEYLNPSWRIQTSWFESHSDLPVALMQWRNVGGSHLTAARRELRERELELLALQGTSELNSEKWNFLVQRHWDPVKYVVALLLTAKLLFLFGFSLRDKVRSLRKRRVLT